MWVQVVGGAKHLKQKRDTSLTGERNAWLGGYTFGQLATSPHTIGDGPVDGGGPDAFQELMKEADEKDKKPGVPARTVRFAGKK